MQRINMDFFGVHIAGFILIVIFVFSLFKSKEFLKNISLKIDIKSSKTLFKNTYVALVCVLILLSFYQSGKSVPFNKTPKIYKDLLKYAESQDIKIDCQTGKAMAFCGAGNIYRCLCEIDKAKNPPKSKASMKKIILKAIEEQKKSKRFLE